MNTNGRELLLVGTARGADRAAYQRRNAWHDSIVGRDSFRPLLRGRGHRSAMSLPFHSRSFVFIRG
jgi:hypothetical protein